MTWYETFLWLHITAAAVWVGGAVMIQAYAFRITRTDDALRIAAFAKDTEVVSMRLFIPTTLVLLATGIGLVLNGNWDWGEPFVVLGLVIWAASFAAGVTYIGPEGGRIAKAVEAGGPDSPEAQQRIRNILRFSRIELVLLLLVIFMMTVKVGT